MRIAAVDDDTLQLELLERTLAQMGHACRTYETGGALLKALRRESFDLLIVDWELPDTSGPQIVAQVREQLGAQLPILFVTHRQTEQDIVQGLACGADDYLSKPVRIAELKARITALLRRAWPEQHAQNDAPLEFGRYRFDPATRSVQVDGQSVELKNREYNLALFMFQNAGRLLSRDHLRDAIWGHSAEVISRTLDTHVSRLRAALDLQPVHGYAITAVYGVGYRLEAVAPPDAPAA